MMNLHRLRSLSLTTAVACTALVGCGGSQREAIIAEPVERPLPPASGTPIGILIDEASRLALRAEQLDALREIDQSLSARNDHIDAQLREMERPKPPPGKPGGGPGGGGMGGPPGGGMGGGMGGPPGGGMGGPPGGGMGGGGMGGPPGGGGGPGGRRGGRGKGPPPGMPPGGGDPRARGRVLEEKTANIRAAIERALNILDPDQRRIAKQLLDERGVETLPKGVPPKGDDPGSNDSDDHLEDRPPPPR